MLLIINKNNKSFEVEILLLICLAVSVKLFL